MNIEDSKQKLLKNNLQYINSKLYDAIFNIIGLYVSNLKNPSYSEEILSLNLSNIIYNIYAEIDNIKLENYKYFFISEKIISEKIINVINPEKIDDKSKADILSYYKKIITSFTKNESHMISSAFLLANKKIDNLPNYNYEKNNESTTRSNSETDRSR